MSIRDLFESRICALIHPESFGTRFELTMSCWSVCFISNWVFNIVFELHLCCWYLCWTAAFLVQLCSSHPYVYEIIVRHLELNLTGIWVADVSVFLWFFFSWIKPIDLYLSCIYAITYSGLFYMYKCCAYANNIHANPKGGLWNSNSVRYESVRHAFILN